jgi:hypothetical protein
MDAVLLSSLNIALTFICCVLFIVSLFVLAQPQTKIKLRSFNFISLTFNLIFTFSLGLVSYLRSIGSSLEANEWVGWIELLCLVFVILNILNAIGVIRNESFTNNYTK